ncbi:MAG: hypothetical protein KGL39_20000 [Patescibacteria group bacterium]|nr:hypothetical protein [Patescibacteria group bacterium]
MIRLLKRFADWLDTRFPAKVVVTEADYRMLQERQIKIAELAAADYSNAMLEIVKLGNRIEAIEKSNPAISISDRLETLEQSVAGLAKALTKPKQSEADILRDQFRRGEFPRTVNRSELEAKA